MFTANGHVLCTECGSHMKASVIEIGDRESDRFEFDCTCGAKRQFDAARPHPGKRDAPVSSDAF